MNESKERKNGAILSYISIATNMIVQLLYTPVLIRMLGQSEYGLYSLTSSIISYLTVLDLGFGNAIIVYTAKYRAKKEYEEEKKMHGMFFLIFCIMGLIATILGLIIFFNITTLFGRTMSKLELDKMKIMMLILTFNLAVTFPFSIFGSIISAYERFTYKKIIAIASTVLKPLIMLPLLFCGCKSITLSIVVTIVNIIMLLSNYFYCREKLDIKIKFTGFNKKIFKTIFGYSFFIFLGVCADRINWSVDNFILGAVLGTTTVSIYSVASTFNQFFINISTAISGVFLPKISKMVARNTPKEEITNEFIKIGRLQYIIVFLMASGFVLFGKQFILYWVGEEFEESYYVALLLIIPLCIPLIQNLGISIMQAMNKHKFRTAAMFIMAIFNAVISLFLARAYGIIGVAAGTAISLIIVNVIAINIYYYRVIKIDIPRFWKEIIKMTIPFMLSIVFFIMITRMIKIKGFIGLIIYIAVYIIIYAIVAYFLTMNDYERNLTKSFLIKWRK